MNCYNIENPSTSLPDEILKFTSAEVPDPDGIRTTLVHHWSSKESSLSNSPSSSQGMLQTPDFNQLTLPDSSSSEQPQPINNTATLQITIQPENTFRFRYDSEILKPHGHLRGICSASNNFLKYPTIDLVFKQDNQDVVSKYFLRCTLHQAPSTPTSSTTLSPHKLLRHRDDDDKSFYDETELYELRKVAPGRYRFKMKNFLINCKQIEKCPESCTKKYQSLIKQNLVIGSKLIFDEPMKLENESSENQDSALGNCANGMSTKRGKKATTKKKQQESAEQKKLQQEQLSQVQIGFEAFQFIDNSYKSIAEPIFSNTIVNGGPLNIIKNCNIKVLKDEYSDVTLLVSSMKACEIKIHIKECGDIQNPWSECILVNKKMFHYKSAITFQAPPYGGTQDAEIIECSIQLERSDDDRSNAVSIIYCNDLKRKRPIGNDITKRPIIQIKSRKIDQAMGGGEGIDESMENRSTTHMTTAEEVPKIPYTNLNKNLELLPGSVIFSAEASNQIEQTVDKGSKDLFNNLEAADNIVSLLCELHHIYNLSKNKPNGANKHERQRVRNLFLAYECRNMLANSVLHDVLEDSKLMKYDIVLHKIIEHYKLEDIISKSSNIYGETALMYACIFKRPLLLSALVNMGTSLTAQDVHGNNVLHLVMQQKQPQQQISDCLNALKQLMKIKKHSNHFIEALGGYNVRGLTPLHLAVLQNNVQIVVDFLDLCKSNGSFEVCLRGQLSDGNTILHLAVLNRLVDMRECILKHSADDAFRNVINFADQTAEDMMDMDEKFFFNFIKKQKCR